MKAVPFRKLEDAVISTNTNLAPLADSKPLILFPLLCSLDPAGNHTDISFFADYPTRSAAGNFLQVPLLIGSTQNEGDIFVVGLEETTLGFTVPVITGLLSDVVTQVKT